MDAELRGSSNSAREPPQQNFASALLEPRLNGAHGAAELFTACHELRGELNHLAPFSSGVAAQASVRFRALEPESLHENTDDGIHGLITFHGGMQARGSLVHRSQGTCLTGSRADGHAEAQEIKRRGKIAAGATSDSCFRRAQGALPSDHNKRAVGISGGE